MSPAALKFNALFVGGPRLKVDTEDLRNFNLLEAKAIRLSDGRLLRMPEGAGSDGASTPQILWSMGLTPFGPEGPADFAHDCGYRGTMEIFRDGWWVPAMLSRDDCDDLYNALMFALGVNETRRLIIYEGVHLGGWRAFREDRAPIAKA